MSKRRKFQFRKGFVDTDPEGEGETPIESLMAGRLVLYPGHVRKMTFATSLEQALETLGFTELVVDGCKQEPPCFIDIPQAEFLDLFAGNPAAGVASDPALHAWSLLEEDEKK